MVPNMTFVPYDILNGNDLKRAREKIQSQGVPALYKAASITQGIDLSVLTCCGKDRNRLIVHSASSLQLLSLYEVGQN